MSLRGCNEASAAVWAVTAVAGEALAWQPVLLGRAFALLFLLTLILRLRNEVRSPVEPAFRAWALLALLALASLLWTADAAATTRVLRHLGQEGLLLLGFTLCPGRERLLRALALGAAAGALFLAVGLAVQLLSGPEEALRVVVGDGDPNLQGRKVALGVLLGAAALRLRGRLRPPPRAWVGLALALAILGGFGLGLAGSRGAFLALLIPAGLLLVRPPEPRLPLRWVAGAALLALGLGITATSVTGGLRSPATGLLDGDREARSSGRDAIWANTLDIVRDHPLLGVGAGAVPAVYDRYRDRRMDEGGLHSKPGRDPHNLYLQLLAELGPAGLLLFGLGVGLALRSMRRSAESRMVSCLLLFALLSALTQSTLELKDFWLALAWAVLAAGLRREAPPGSS